MLNTIQHHHHTALQAVRLGCDDKTVQDSLKLHKPVPVSSISTCTTTASTEHLPIHIHPREPISSSCPLPLDASMASQTTATDATHALPGGLTPDSIDVPSELAQILSRVRYSDKNSQQQQQQSSSAGGAADPTAAAAASQIPIKDLPAAIDPLRHKIQRARAAVHALPDVRRTIPEQEAEAAALRARIEKQRAALLQLKEFGLRFAAENGDGDRDVEMTGTEAVGGGGAQGGSSSG